jgi:two-component system sensor histidine kinase HydH
LRLAEGVKKEVARINTRISEFLNYTRPSRLELRPLDLRAEIADALLLVETQAAESNIEIRLEQRGDIPEVLGDRESLRSVMTNLIINALQAIEGDAGRLTIELSATASEVTTRITDTGSGIAAENLPQIFEPYFSTKDTGTGLGLAIVKRAIDDHHGRIEVESTQGAGTTFIVTLPTAEVRG